jgi:hypothetical protein
MQSERTREKERKEKEKIKCTNYEKKRKKNTLVTFITGIPVLKNHVKEIELCE